MDSNVNPKKMKLMVSSVISLKAPEILYFWKIWYQLDHLLVQSFNHQLIWEEYKEKMLNFPSKEKTYYYKGKLQGLNNKWEKGLHKDTLKLPK